MKINFNIPEESAKFYLNLNSKVKKIKTVKIEIPENAIDFEETLRKIRGY